jgi:exportin-7
LEQLSIIERFEYEQTCAVIVQLFDVTARQYHELLTPPSSNAIEIQIHEGQLTWLVYIIGSAIGGRLSFPTNDHDVMDGDLIIRVDI